MTPEQFEAKWGPALRAAGIYFHCRVDVEVPRALIRCMWFMGNEVVNGDAEALARGLLVAWAAERHQKSVRYDGTEAIGDGEWRHRWHMGTRDVFPTFDAALTAGVIAQAEMEGGK
jgi:hypothetical protein